MAPGAVGLPAEDDRVTRGARRAVILATLAAGASVLAGFGFGGNLLYQAHGRYGAPPDQRWIVDAIVGFAFCLFAVQAVSAVRLFGSARAGLVRARRHAIGLGALGIVPLLLGGYMMAGLIWELAFSAGRMPVWVLAIFVPCSASWVAGGAAPWLLLIRHGAVMRAADRAAAGRGP